MTAFHLRLSIPIFILSVDPDQMAFSADLDLQCFQQRINPGMALSWFKLFAKLKDAKFYQFTKGFNSLIIW